MAKETVKPPKTGEETKAQTASSTNNIIHQAVGGQPVHMPGVATQPGTYKTYRRMISNPTIALARAASTAPVRAAKWGVQSEEGVPEEWKNEIQEAMKPLYPQLIKDMLRSLDYGWAGFEKVFEIRKGLVTYSKIKALLVDITDIQIDKNTGDFAGFRQGKVEIDADKSVIFTHDGEAGNLHGRSRNENCRPEWSQWNHALGKSGQYITKAAGVIPMIEYPEGVSNDANGKEVDNAVHAATMLRELGMGHGIYMPNTLAKFAEDLARSGVDISQLKSWLISFLETKGRHGQEIVEMMGHLESLMMRGWLVPERSALEGKHGTKAESEVHADLALVVSYLLLLDITDAINRQIVDPLLQYNHGLEAKGSVFIVPEELGSDEQIFFRDLLKQVFANPQNLDLFLNVLNVDALLDIAGLPKSDTGDISRIAEDASTSIDDRATPEAAAMALSRMYAKVAELRRKAQK